MTASPLPETSAPPWRMRLEVDEPGSRVAAAIAEDGTIIGLAAAGVSRDDDAPTRWELYSINVLAAQQGSGVADELIGVTLGQGEATVWVLAGNRRAQGFYRRHGFRPEGSSRTDELNGASEIRMVRHSGGAPAGSETFSGGAGAGTAGAEPV